MPEFVGDLKEDLWNDDDTEGMNNELYHQMLMEQYKVYVEVADRMSARRTFVNACFITLHAIIISVLGLSLSRSPYVPQIGLLLIPLLALLILCYAWGRIVQYYRRKCSAKARIIGELERRLPSNASWRAEEKISKATSSPIRAMEINLPFFFAVLYILAYCYVVYLSYQ